jgi:tetraacyldisaccharide 4'-kinase
MDRQRAIEIMSGRRRGPGAAVVRAATWLLSKPYGVLVRLRRRLYRLGVLGSHRARAPVISVGNITTGGTGKTPMVAWVVERLREAGRAPAILTRGYKAVEGASDEAEMLWKLTRAPVVADPDRVGSAAAAVEAGADVLVLDDGFQHRRLRRDLDIVLIDATSPFGFGHCLPRGLLREPLSALGAADAVLITRSDMVSPAELEALSERLARLAPRASMHRAGHAPTAVVIGAGRHLPADYLAGKKIVAFCGIGNPDAFFAGLEAIGAELAGRIAFDDHVAYGEKELARIRAAAERHRPEALVTTAKDRVKLVPKDLPVPLWTLKIEVRVTAGEEALVEKIRKVLGR